MSVIFGITEENRIILAGDKRVTDVTDGSFSDDAQKVIQINKQLCIAFAGNMAVMTSIMKKVEATENKDTLVTDDLLEIINSFYKKVVEKECDVIYGYAFYCLIAGKGKDGKDYLYNAGKFKNGFEYREVPMALYPPTDADQKKCNEIFVKNYYSNKNDFWTKTVEEIWQLSSMVSSVGDCWIYNRDTCMGKLVQF